MKRLLSTALILILISVPVYADDFKDAEEALNREDYSTAFNKLKPLAERGDTSSCGFSNNQKCHQK